ncbi:hypothetical protein [Rubellicoccus peritrichatus]|uniref:Uncharacterized protein n=1 Tax=Rubellicoccus peritrichatus TaxID=3080537 RepID=A0AAQ3L820_9BACT|nr:hypothetical protein [Puniceicoccus sp. CR14]WOO39457.1 hypothetical protein RZN69_12605 [Puniceicoccus sp. CR14]
MSNIQKVGAAAIVVIAVIAYFLIGGDDAESAINKRLDELEALASKTGKESQFDMLGKAKKASGYVVEQPYLELLPGYDIVGDRDALTGMLVSLRGRVSTADVDFSGRQISIGDSGKTALVNATVSAKAEGYGDGRTHRSKYRMEWVEQNGDWLIARVELLER